VFLHLPVFKKKYQKQFRDDTYAEFLQVLQSQLRKLSPTILTFPRPGMPLMAVINKPLSTACNIA
jgi:hypothetical protein